MKKFLRISLMLLVALTCGIGHASTVVFDATVDKVGDAHDVKLLTMTKAGITLKAVRMAGSRDTALVGTFGQGERYELNGVTVNPQLFDSRLYITSTVGNYNKVVFTCVGTGEGEVGPGGIRKRYGYTFEPNGHTGTFVCNTREEYLSIYRDVWITKIEVTLDGVVIPPAIVGDEQFTGATTVTLQAGEGAKIYYTTDGSEPTANDANLYNGPFPIYRNTTVKAFAVEGNGRSAVVEKKFVNLNVSSIAEFQQMPVGSTVTFVSPVWVTYADTNNPATIYTTDGSGYMAITNPNFANYENGHQIPAGFSGTVSNQDGVITLNDAQGLQPVGARTRVWPPEELTEEQVTASKINAYVVLENVTLHDVNGRNFVLGNGLQGYNKFDNVVSLASTSEKGIYTVLGIVGYREGKVVIMPTRIIEAQRIVSCIADLKEIEDPKRVRFTSPVTVTKSSASQALVFIKDATGYASMFSSIASEMYKTGDVIPAGFEGEYSGDMQLSISEGLQPATEHVDVAPEVKTEADITVDLKFTYVKLENVKLHGVNGEEFTIGNGLRGINLFADEISLDSIDEDAVYNITGIVDYFDGVLLLPTKIELAAVSVNSIAEFNQAKDSAQVVFASPVTVTYAYKSTNGRTEDAIFAKDATGYMFITGDSLPVYKNGDVLPAGFGGTKYVDQSNAPRLMEPTGLKPATGTASANPEVVTEDEVTADKAYAYVKLNNVKLTKVQDQVAMINGTLICAAILDNQVSLDSINENSLYSVTGVVVDGGGAMAVIPTEIEETMSAVSSIAEYNQAEDFKTVKFTSPVTVTFANNEMIFVKDGTGYMGMRGNFRNMAYKNGDVIPAGFVGQVNYVAGNRMLVEPYDLQPATETADAAPEVKAVDEITEELHYAYVKLENVKLQMKNDFEFTIDSKLDGYNLFVDTVSLEDIDELSQYDVTGIVDQTLEGNMVLYPTEVVKRVVTGVDAVQGAKAVAKVQYMNVAGQVSSEPFDGVNIVVTTYVDGSKRVVKVVK